MEKGLEEVKLKTALEMFAKGKSSTGEAAEISGLSIGEFMDEMVKRGLKPRISEEDLKGSLERAMKAVR